jgi:hypothetical protein
MDNSFDQLELRPDTPDLWRKRCSQPATLTSRPTGQGFLFEPTTSKLRSVYATIPMGFASPESVKEANLTVSLANV